MKNKFYQYIMQIAKDANGIVNNQKVNRIKKSLVIVGASLLFLGIIMLIIGILAAPALFFIAVILGLFPGAVCLQLGVLLYIAGVGTRVLDKSIKCPTCGNIIEDNEIFCSKCGTSLRAQKVCSECKTTNEPNDDFCRNCGHNLND